MVPPTSKPVLALGLSLMMGFPTYLSAADDGIDPPPVASGECS